MNKYERALKSFYQSNRDKGRNYFLDDRVFDLETINGGYAATVRGSGYMQYRVKLLVDENRVSYYTCTCPVRGECKHIAAVLYYLMANEEEAISQKEIIKETVKGSPEAAFASITKRLDAIPKGNNNLSLLNTAEKLFLSVQQTLNIEQKTTLFKRFLSYDVGYYRAVYSSTTYDVSKLISSVALSKEDKANIIIELAKERKINNSLTHIIFCSFNNLSFLKEPLIKLINEDDDLYRLIKLAREDDLDIKNELLRKLNFEKLKKIVKFNRFSPTYFEAEDSIINSYAAILMSMLLIDNYCYYANNLNYQKIVAILTQEYKTDEIEFGLKNFLLYNSNNAKIYMMVRPYINTPLTNSEVKAMNIKEDTFEYKFIRLLESNEDFEIDDYDSNYLDDDTLLLIYRKSQLSKPTIEKKLYKNVQKYAKNPVSHHLAAKCIDALIYNDSKYVKNIKENKQVLEAARDSFLLRNVLVGAGALDLDFDIYPIKKEDK